MPKYINREGPFDSKERAVFHAGKRKRDISEYNNKNKHHPLLRIVIVGEGKEGAWYVYEYEQRRRGAFKPFEPLTKSQIDIIINSERDMERRHFINLMAYSGRRVSEICGKYGIRPIDINPEDSFIRFIILKKRGVKSQEDRERVIIPRNVIDDLQTYIHVRRIKDKEIIFKHGRRWAWNIIRDVSNRHSIKLWPHLFRHSYAAMLAQAAETPADVTKIQDQLKHADVSMTYDYIRTFNTKKTKELIDKAFKENENDSE